MKVNLNNAIKKFLESIRIECNERTSDNVKYTVYTSSFTSSHIELFKLKWEKEEPYTLEGYGDIQDIEENLSPELLELIVTYLIKEKRKFFKEDIDKINITLYYDFAGFESEYFEYEK